MVSRRTIAKIARESRVAAASTLSCFMAARSTHSADESQRSIDDPDQKSTRLTDLKIHQREVSRRYGFIKAWRAKIFAKIEWKDTSKKNHRK